MLTAALKFRKICITAVLNIKIWWWNIKNVKGF